MTLKRRILLITVAGSIMLGALATTQISAKRTNTYNLDIILVGLGKNHTRIDEDQYSFLQRVYNPNLKPEPLTNVQEQLMLVAGIDPKPVYSGAPEILAEWSAKVNLRHRAILYSQIGTGIWEGTLNPKSDNLSDLFRSRGIDYKLEKATLGDVVVPVCGNGRSVNISRKVRNYEGDDILALGQPLPDIVVTDRRDQQVQLNDLFTEGRPALVVFYDTPLSDTVHTLLDQLASQ